jgi:DNA-binding NtrC family response regulator
MKMNNEYRYLSLHQKMAILAQELVERDLPLKESVKEFEKLFIAAAEKKYKGNKTRMAEAMGIHRNTLHNLYKSLDL